MKKCFYEDDELNVELTDEFNKMDIKSQSLYFTLSAQADSIGYISDVSSITEDYPSYCFQDLIINSFIIKYGTGYLVIRNLSQLK